MILELILAIIGSGALSALISGIFQLINNRKGKFAAIEKRLGDIDERLNIIEQKQKISEKDELRTQLLLLLADYSHDTSEIMKIAEHYFSDLEGNWYCTSLFNTWLEDNMIAKPEWFKD